MVSTRSKEPLNLEDLDEHWNVRAQPAYRSAQKGPSCQNHGSPLPSQTKRFLKYALQRTLDRIDGSSQLQTLARIRLLARGLLITTQTCRMWLRGLSTNNPYPHLLYIVVKLCSFYNQHTSPDRSFCSSTYQHCRFRTRTH